MVTDELAGPNGIALSPDERHLDVGNWEPGRSVVMRYPMSGAPGEVLVDLSDVEGEDSIDGIKVDRAGHLYVCGPGGIWLDLTAGAPARPAAAAGEPARPRLGDPDGRTLYVTALTSIYRVRLAIAGIRPQ